MCMQHPLAACAAGVLYILGTLLNFQRVVQCHLHCAGGSEGGSKGKLWSSVLRGGTLTASISFYALLAITCKWCLEWVVASRRN